MLHPPAVVPRAQPCGIDGDGRLRGGPRQQPGGERGGFGAEITATTPVNLKKALGGGAYALMGLVKASDLSPYAVKLEVGGKETLSGQMLFMA